MAFATKKPRGTGAGTIVARLTVGLTGLAILFHAPVSVAKTPAPIVFASATDGERSTGRSGSGKPGARKYTQYANAPIESASISSASGTREYRYPDQPNVVFGASGARQLGSQAAPMAFSSSTAAINPEAARKFSSSNAAQGRVPVGFAKQKIGSPYQISGRWYVPAEEPDYDEVGVGSWYGPKFNGRPTATGEIFDQYAMTAAHTTLPIPSLARVTNLENGRTIVVRINDRGPFIDNRIIDLSKKAAQTLDYHDQGKARVRVEYLGPAPKAANTLPAKYVALNEAATRGESVAPAPRQAQATQGTYLLQAGSFSDIANAHDMRAELGHLGTVFLKEAQVNGRDYFRVMMGPWPSKQQAEHARRQLLQQGVNTVVVASK